MQVCRKHSVLLLFLWVFCLPVMASLSPADSLEMRILAAAERGAVADELGSAFHARPDGEVLLLPPNKDLRFAILIYNIDILPDRAQFSAGLAFRDGRSNQLVAFKTDNIHFYYKQGLTGPVRMQLISDVTLRLGRAATVQFFGGYNQTWAEFDCHGLSQFGITAQARINSDVLVPVNADHKVIPDSALTCLVQMNVKSWDELLLSVSLQPFQIKGFNGYVFNISKATLDLSADMNAAGMQLPDDYRDPGFDATWEGFYLAEGKMYFPRHFAQDSIASIISIHHLMLDETGFSGQITGNNILSPDKGNIAGWKFGIDNAQISFYRNCLKKAVLDGPLGLPVLPDTQFLRYQALLGFEDQFNFRVFNQNEVSFPALKAGKVFLDSGSQVYLESIRGDITARALLHGRLQISIPGNGAEKQLQAHFNGIAFQGLSLSNKAPKLGIQYLGIGQTPNASQRIGNFPITLYSVSFSVANNQPSIGFGLGLNLSEKLACNTRFTIYTALKNERKTDRLAFVKVQLDDIYVRAEISNISFTGSISIMRSDPVYGDGFSGSIAFGVKLARQAINGSCKAMFGNIRSQRYWYFDASLAVTGPGIPLAPAVSLNGFLGGAWHRMRVLKPNELPPNSIAGRSENGRIYVPDSAAGLGLRAGVFLKSTAQGAFEGNAVLDIQFNRNGGLANINMTGTADFFIKPAPLNQSVFAQKSIALCTAPGSSQFVPKGSMAAALEMVLDFDKEVYHANMKMYVNVATSSMGLKGKGHYGYAGQMNMFFTPTDWYVWIGNSQQPLQVEAKIPGAFQFAASAYFMAGTKVLPAPPLPENIRKAVGYQAQFDRNTEMLSKGTGFALGAAMRTQIGGEYKDKKLAIYATGSAESGFDILMQQYHGSVICQQTGERPGVNGWFAGGKYYIGASLNLGIRYKSKDYQIANMGIGAVLSGQGPNPIYAHGLAGIHVNLLIVKINENIRLEIGKKCDLSETRYNAIPIISIEEPAQGKDVSVLVRPRVAFAMPVNKEFQDANQRRLRFVADLVMRKSSIRVPGKWIVSDNGEQALFQPDEALQSQANYTVAATLFLEAWESRSSEWIRIKNNGSEVIEQKTMSFNTGDAPSTIPFENVAAAYPQIGQVNVHRDYSDKGFVELKVSQWKSFSMPGTHMVARFSAQNGECREVLAEIRGFTAHFSIPKSLSHGRVYRFALVRRSATAALMNLSSGFQEIQGSPKPVSGTVMLSGSTTPSSSNANSSGKSSSPAISDAVILSYWFRNSLYGVPSEKWSDCKVTDVVASPGQKWLQISQSAGEYLQLSELQQPILHLSADMGRNTWFRQSVYPLVYGLYYGLAPGIRAGVRWNRDTSEGLISNALENIEQAGIEQVQLKQSHYASGTYTFQNTTLQLRYLGLQTIEADLQTLKQCLSEQSIYMDIATLEKILTLLPKSSSNAQVIGPVNSMPAPFSAYLIQGKNTVAQQVWTMADNRQNVLRNRLLLLLNNLKMPAAPQNMIIPLRGVYQCGSYPPVKMIIGKGGLL